MPGFNYTAIDRNGKRVRSSLDASSIETAKSSLRGAGYTILDIKEQTTLNRDIEIPFLGKPKAKDMAVFCRQFVSILRAGVSVASVLAMLGQQTSNKKLRAAIREMQADVEKGESLATSMRRHPKIFPAILVNMVAAGESSGNLEESFRQMELYFERSKRTKSKVTSAMIYPCVLIVVMIVVLIVMMTKIIPNFLKTFEDMDAELPKLTQGVMAVCEWFESWWWVPLLVLVALIVGGVKKFVMISTDKAVNPTNFMGATKRFCEMILQSRTDSPTEFCAVRFGNVLGSNGSVVPLFKKQIQEGGPVTITDRRIIRYFMTIPEAAQLVLEAGAMAKQSEIFVLDMGEPVKILELAENLIRLSGLELDKDITIQEIGLRPGEKLYEELLMRSETLSKTSNEKIFIEQQQDISKDVIMDDLLRLDEAVTRDIPPQDLITMLREMVPTYTSPEEINGRATAEVS